MFTATIFETEDHLGGQWQYTEPDPVTGEIHSSIYEGVVFHSCRDTSNFSDFPDGSSSIFGLYWSPTIRPILARVRYILQPAATHQIQYEDRKMHTLEGSRHRRLLEICRPSCKITSRQPQLRQLLYKVFDSNPIRASSLLNAVHMAVPSPGQFRLFGSGSSPDVAEASIENC
jgi:hypothetical protein